MKRLHLLAAAAILPLLLATQPAAALTAAQKMETCKFGADDQKLSGTKRKQFIARCMSNRNDPRGPTPKTAMKPAPAVPPPPKQ